MKKTRVIIVMVFIILVIAVASVINLVLHYGARLTPTKIGEMGNKAFHGKTQQLQDIGVQPYWLIALVGGVIVLYILFNMINGVRRRRRFHKSYSRFR